ncbi:hypothetical protein QBC47DRAFT_293595 [Echria macrotheca]|uniref:Zn(2)-C6 fungal-type domain-containing protein n=1 Tax=Echria macrotheca TaxID=438768 RepID=A0AAJ0F9M1_9PEZI|nr:hypothetical protein QBC47DRAFT_293595 [Echria macrotheca]
MTAESDSARDKRQLVDDIGSEAKAAAAAPAVPVVSKSRRVRTGCLTCRERHLKCDEGLPECNNCRKSSRECKRGVRLNFIDTQVKKPPVIPPTLEWSVQFQDESRLIASEYRGGLGRYRAQKDITPPREPDAQEVVRTPPDQPEAAAQEAQTLTLPLNPRGWHQQPAYDDSHFHRRDSDAFLPQPALPPVSQPTPLSVAGSNSSGMLHDPYTIREDAFRRSHVSRNSDVSNLPSPYYAQGPASTPQGYRSGSHGTPQLQSIPDGPMTPPNEKVPSEKDYLSTEDEIRFMQVFVDEVAVWMDLLDKDKQFSTTIPYLALESPMLLNALLACGVKRSTLVDGQSEEKALYYYDTATKQLLRCLQNPDRNMAECAATAVVLNVYEVMTDKPSQRMSHIAGARALIRECGWDATSPGLGGACFWVNIGMEVLSCLSFNWQTAWDPDQWGLDLEFTNWTATPRTSSSVDGGEGDSRINKITDGDEELWVQRIFYILAKITNFRANIPRFQEPSPHDEQVRKQTRFNEWKRLKALCDAWNLNCPRSMKLYAYSQKPSGKSLFPNVWLIKRPAILGRIYYHTALCLLAQMNPVDPHDSEDNRVSQQFHARHICGILAHTNDTGVKNGAIRCLAVAGAALTDRLEQKEVLEIFGRISRETGWRLDKVCRGLKETWRWEEEDDEEGTGGRARSGLAPLPTTTGTSSSTASGGGGGGGRGSAGPPPPGFFGSGTAESTTGSTTTTSTPPVTSTGTGTTTTVAAPTPTRPVINPLLANADFSRRDHPYQNWYEPPSAGRNAPGRDRDGSATQGGGLWPS